jgi:hypothetical protein
MLAIIGLIPNIGLCNFGIILNLPNLDLLTNKSKSNLLEICPLELRSINLSLIFLHVFFNGFLSNMSDYNDTEAEVMLKCKKVARKNLF